MMKKTQWRREEKRNKRNFCTVRLLLNEGSCCCCDFYERMAKRRVDDILNETLPEKSKELYLKRWMDLMDFMGEPARRPTETDYLQYFDFLKTTKNHAVSSVWSIYSSLNSIHQREFNEKLQSFPRVTQLLKTYNTTYERKVASILEEGSQKMLPKKNKIRYWPE